MEVMAYRVKGYCRRLAVNDLRVGLRGGGSAVRSVLQSQNRDPASLTPKPPKACLLKDITFKSQTLTVSET